MHLGFFHEVFDMLNSLVYMVNVRTLRLTKTIFINLRKQLVYLYMQGITDTNQQKVNICGKSNMKITYALVHMWSFSIYIVVKH